MSSIINKIFNKEEENKQPAKKVAVKIAPKADKAETKKTATVAVEKRTDNDIYRILQSPVITEKATDLTQYNKYTFAVPLKASKSEVAKKVMNLYGVKPIKVNVIKVLSKKVRRGRTFGKTVAWKKAIVTLAKNDKIEIYEGV